MDHLSYWLDMVVIYGTAGLYCVGVSVEYIGLYSQDCGL